MPRAHRLLASALLISLAAHLLMLASAGSWWTPAAAEIPFPIEANLLPPPAKAVPAAAITPPKPKAIQAAPVAPAVVATPVPSPPVEPPPEPVSAPAAAPVAVAVETAIPAPPAVPLAPVPAAAALAPVLRNLPERLNLRYAVRAGDGGFNLGQAIYSWQRRDGHYSLVSIAQTTGLASLFVSGKLVQTSEGSITAHGLQPEQYWLSRSERKQDTARFDWGAGRLVLGNNGIELPPGSQDVLSFPFHLAMTVGSLTTEWTLAVTNGRKLREYQFRNLGLERLVHGESEIDTLHLQGSRSGEGTLDVWLAPSRHWLPLRIRTLDQKGKVMVLSLEE